MNGGIHVLLDIVTPAGASSAYLVDSVKLSLWCRQAAEAAGATVLHNYWHTFGVTSGVTGVVLLAESHITVHTYPEHNLATFDIYVCGSCDPLAAAKYLMERIGDGEFKFNVISRRAD